MKIFNQKLIIRVVVIIGSVLMVVTLTIAILICFINPNNYKEYLTNKFFRETGRQLLLKGPISLKLYPEIQVIAKNIEIANPKELSESNFLELDSMDVHISIMALLKGSVTINQLIIEGVNLYLLKDKQGNNWNFNLSTQKNKSKESNISLVLKKLLFKNIRVNYKDLDKSINIQTKNFNLLVNKNSGSIIINKNQIKFSNTNINLNNEFYSNLNLYVVTKPNLKYDGDIKIESFSLNKISDTLGLNNTLPQFINRPAYSNISFNSNLKGDDNSFNFNNLYLILNQTKIHGNILFNLKPYEINQTLLADSAELSDFVDLRGFKLKLDSTKLTGNAIAESITNLSNLNGKEQLAINKITLYGFDIRRFSKQTSKLINSINTLNKLVTYTQTKATLNELRKSLNKLQGQRKKNYSDTSDLGTLRINAVAKNGYVSIPECKLSSLDVRGICDGYINFQKNSLNIILQVRLLSQGEQTFINYIYFPYYFRGRFSNMDNGLDWQSIAKQTTKYYKTNDKDKPVLNKALDSITDIFKDESK